MTTDRMDPNRPLFADMDDDDEPTSSTNGSGQPMAADPLTIDSASVGAIPLGAPATADDDEGDPVDGDVSDPRGH